MEPVKNEPLPSLPDVALYQEKFRANVQTIRKSVAVTLGVPLLMFLGSCFLMNHDTYQPVFFFCLIVLLLAVPLVMLAFMSALGCPNPNCGREIMLGGTPVQPTPAPPNASWWQQRQHASRDLQRMRQEAADKTLISLDNAFYTVFTRDGYTCPKCKIVLREGPRGKWSIVKILAYVGTGVMLFIRFFGALDKHGFFDNW